MRGLGQRALLVALCLACTAMAVWLFACGSSKPGARTEGDASPDVLAVDGQAEGGTTGIGVVTFSEYPDAGGKFFAGFTETPPTTSVTCTVVDAGACVTTSCPPAVQDAGGDGDAAKSDAAATPAPNPGPLRLTGGAFGAAGITVAPDKGGTYLYESPGTLFAPGNTLGVSAAGGQLPAFPEQSVTVSPAVQLTAPTADGGKISVPTSQPLTVSWTGGQTGAKLVLSATALFTTGGEATMTCTWDAASGTADIPSAALKPLAVENALTSGLGWFQAASTQFTTGNVSVTMTAYVAQQVLAGFQ